MRRGIRIRLLVFRRHRDRRTAAKLRTPTDRLVTQHSAGVFARTFIRCHPRRRDVDSRDCSSGELVRISGRYRRGRAIASQAAFPLLIFDSELGPEAGLRLKLESDWKPFELIREIAPGSNSLSISAALTGMGEVQMMI